MMGGGRNLAKTRVLCLYFSWVLPGMHSSCLLCQLQKEKPCCAALWLRVKNRSVALSLPLSSGDDPPACDRGEDEPEPVSALQSSLCGRWDPGWNWWVCQKTRGALNLKWNQRWNPDSFWNHFLPMNSCFSVLFIGKLLQNPWYSSPAAQGETDRSHSMFFNNVLLFAPACLKKPCCTEQHRLKWSGAVTELGHGFQHALSCWEMCRFTEKIAHRNILIGC